MTTMMEERSRFYSLALRFLVPHSPPLVAELEADQGEIHQPSSRWHGQGPVQRGRGQAAHGETGDLR